MLPPLVAQGFELAALGMSTVFIFLTLLVFATMTMSKLVSLTTPVVIKQKAIIPGTGTINPKKLAIIAAAIHQHRNQQSLHGNRQE
ncbi:MAG: oxaloacetate decarboxylase gamma subunit [Candidatus Azotimanducaceae bacterium]|jgi:oxaloacetate decarboxylase gamma subunit